ncbi:MAG: NADH-quinone oxidoreductase subunit B family protein [Candidatus Thorarchaeota archaeon]
MGFLKRLINKARVQSPYVFHFNSGSCNGCDIEIIATLMPRIDLERFGVKLVGSPRHADIMLITGPVTEQIKPRLQKIYEQMAEPKFVVAIGSCACSGGVFRGGYNVMGGVDQAIPVTAYVPGCPPKPSAITFGAYKLLEVLSVALNEEAPESTTKVEEEVAEV